MLKQKHFIDTHKGITPLFIISLINYYNQWDNYIALLYLSLHGTYGLLWITKSYIYPDKQWESKTSIFYGLLIWTSLSLYWVAPFLIVSKKSILPIISDPPLIYFSICISVYIIGIFLHFTSDMQKFIHLKLKPRTLIQNHMFLKVRNTNYLGEFFIYLGFVLLACDWIPIIALLLFIFIVWIPNMINKDKSLSRYDEFKDYKKATKRFLPFIY